MTPPSSLTSEELRERAVQAAAAKVETLPDDSSSTVIAETVIDALSLSWPCSRCERVSGDGICWFHNV